MASPYTQQKIENWVSDFCVSDGIDSFSGPVREMAGSVLLTFLTAACAIRKIEPDEIEEADVRAAVMGPVAALAINKDVRWEIPGLCGAFLTYLQAEGRLSGGNLLAAFAKALTPVFMEQNAAKPKPFVRGNTKLSRNDPCPCGSGKKYKKCCLGQ